MIAILNSETLTVLDLLSITPTNYQIMLCILRLYMKVELLL